jgi:hypothetical protein
MNEGIDNAHHESWRRMATARFTHIGVHENRAEKFYFFRHNALKTLESDE